MKRLWIMFLALVIMLSTNCALASENNDTKTGSLAMMGVTPSELVEMITDHMLLSHDITVELGQQIFYDNLTSLLMGLNSGEVDNIAILKSTAEYLLSQNPNFAIEPLEYTYTEYFSMVVLQENQELYNLLNNTLIELLQDGTVDKLVEEHITGFINEKNPQVITMPKFEGAPTIRVAVTGDLPPMDYVSADGTPAGFNLALLSKIAERTQTNIEIVVVENTARSIALSSGKADVIFWSKQTQCPLPDCEHYMAVEVSEHSLFSVYYFKDDVVHVVKK
ncbi:MAG: transporter substrate-binding domain-containing protein [Christensenellales bacterium]|nr:transporter substrate-binding domain-containing protein [Christensenellales bacterium]